MRCARCGESWTPVPAAVAEREPAVEAMVPVPAEPVATPVRLAPAEMPNVIERTGVSMMSGGVPGPRLADDLPVLGAAPGGANQRRGTQRGAGRALLAAAWLATVLLLAGLGWAVITRRAEIMQAWPPSQRAYAALGLAAPAAQARNTR